jgi:hypothetical protein
MPMDADPEMVWDSLLSRDPERIRDIWQKLSREEQDAVYAHLKLMVSEEGWIEAQRISAQAALDTLPPKID